MNQTQADTTASASQPLSSYGPESSSDNLPGYEDTPAYSAQTFHQPLSTYHLRVTKPNISHLVSYEANASVYIVRYRSTIALPLFNRKGDIRISRKPASSLDEEVVVTRADFCDKGKLPYCPQARFTVKSDGLGGQEMVVDMEAKDWKNWMMVYGGESYIWTLRDVPACIELSSTLGCKSPVIARFMYGKVGTKVQAGGEAGQLEIFRDALTEIMEGRDVVITGCLVAVKYFDGLGRKFRNDGCGGGAAAALINARAQQTNKARTKIMLF